MLRLTGFSRSSVWPLSRSAQPPVQVLPRGTGAGISRKRTAAKGQALARTPAQKKAKLREEGDARRAGSECKDSHWDRIDYGHNSGGNRQRLRRLFASVAEAPVPFPTSMKKGIWSPPPGFPGKRESPSILSIPEAAEAVKPRGRPEPERADVLRQRTVRLPLGFACSFLLQSDPHGGKQALAKGETHSGREGRRCRTS
jgi:hypothetical protein